MSSSFGAGIPGIVVDIPINAEQVESKRSEKKPGKVTIAHPSQWGGAIYKISLAFSQAIVNNVCLLQHRADTLGCEIDKKFRSLSVYIYWVKLERLLDQQFNGDWKKNLAKSLAALPLKSAANVIQIIYQYIKAVLNAIVHPVGSSEKLVNQLKLIAMNVTQPEFWSLLGSGMIGSSLGSTAVGNPLSVIGVIVGVASMAGGLSAGAIKAALNNKENRLSAAGQNFKKQLALLPQNFSNALFLGLFMGGIQKALAKKPVPYDKWAPTKKFADDYLEAKGLPRDYTDAVISPWPQNRGNIYIRYFDDKAVEAAKHPAIAEYIRKTAASPSHPGFQHGTIEFVVGPVDPRLAVHGSSNWGFGRQYDVVATRLDGVFGPYRLPTEVDISPLPAPVYSQPIAVATIAYPAIFASQAPFKG